MRISKKSKMLMTFFTKNKYINHIEQTSRTNNIISDLYNDILNAYNFLSNLKQTRGSNFYNITTKKIHSSVQITRPKNFNSNSFPVIDHYNHRAHQGIGRISPIELYKKSA